MNNQNNNNQNNENNGNFFNDNPMLAFGIFILVMVILFKSFMGDSNLTGIMGNPAISKIEQVKYSDIRKLVKNKEVKSVKITSTMIEAISTSGNKKFVAKNIPAYDMEFIPLLEANEITYEGQVGEGPFARYFNMFLPIIFIIAIWLFLAKKMSKGMGGNFRSWKSR